MGCLLGWVGSGLFARNFKLVNVELLMDPNTDWAQILIRTFCGGVWREGGGGEPVRRQRGWQQRRSRRCQPDTLSAEDRWPTGQIGVEVLKNCLDELQNWENIAPNKMAPNARKKLGQVCQE